MKYKTCEVIYIDVCSESSKFAPSPQCPSSQLNRTLPAIEFYFESPNSISLDSASKHALAIQLDYLLANHLTGFINNGLTVPTLALGFMTPSNVQGLHRQ
jgi:hypothetical protein